jgi:hypothetical protein
MPKIIKGNWRNIHRFEQAHGEIKDTEQPPIPKFGPAGQDNYRKGSEMEPFFQQYFSFSFLRRDGDLLVLIIL